MKNFLELKKKVSAFIASRKQPEGGYSFSATTASSLEDTYYALLTLHTLRLNYKDAKTKQYLKELLKTLNLNIEQIYQVVHLNKLMHLSFSSKNLKKLLMKKQHKLEGIADLYHYAQTYKLLNRKNPPLLDQIRAYKLEAIKYIFDMHYLLWLLQTFHVYFPKKACITWIQNCQNGDGGFGFNPGTTSFIKNSYHALKSLHILGKEPKDILLSEEFIFSCQNKSGGFARQKKALATLEATYHAIQGIIILREMQ